MRKRLKPGPFSSENEARVTQFPVVQGSHAQDGPLSNPESHGLVSSVAQCSTHDKPCSVVRVNRAQQEARFDLEYCLLRLTPQCRAFV